MGLLVLERQANQQIVIADGEVILTVKRIRGNRVTLVFEADKDLKIMRGEVANKPKKAKVAS